jgi:hypothetical protein
VAQVGRLSTSLTLESQDFVVGLRKAVDQTQRSASSIEKNFNRVVGAAKALGAALALDAVAGVAQRALDYASSLGEVAQQLGVTTRDLQTYRYAASQVGISQEEMDKSLARLTRTIGEAAAGNKAQAQTFREIGVSVTAANGRLLTAGEVIPRIADALAKVKDPATRARIEVDLFGKAGQKLDTLLSGGSAAINNLRDAAEKLGVVLSDEQIQRADETADKLSAIKQVLEANIAAAVADNAEAIVGLANSFTSLASGIAQFWSQNPRQAYGLMGAMLGFSVGRVAGPWGAAAGGAAGYAFGRANAPMTDAQSRDRRIGQLERALQFENRSRRRPRFEAELRRLKDERNAEFLGGLPTLPPELRPATAVVGGGDLPVVSGGGGGRSRGGGRSKSDAENFSEWLTRVRVDARDAADDVQRLLDMNPDEVRADHYEKLGDRLGWNKDGELSGIMKDIDARKDAVLQEAELRADVNERLFARQQDQVRTLSGLYEQLMTGGTKGFLRTLKSVGIAIIAEMAARMTVAGGGGGGGLLGAFQGALGAVLPGFGGGGGLMPGGRFQVNLPGFASGGSFRVGGVEGVDRNLVAFRATKNEIVDIRRPGQARGGAIAHIVPSKLFDVIIDERADMRVAAHAPAIARGSSDMTIKRLGRPTL